MSIIYSDNEPRQSFNGINVSAMNPHKPYRTHLENYYYLQFIRNNGTTQERRQAESELVICERKLAYWKRHPSFNIATAAQITEEVKSMWSQTKKAG